MEITVNFYLARTKITKVTTSTVTFIFSSFGDVGELARVSYFHFLIGGVFEGGVIRKRILLGLKIFKEIKSSEKRDFPIRDYCLKGDRISITIGNFRN